MRTCCALVTFISLAIGTNASDQVNPSLAQPVATSWSKLAALRSGKSFDEDNFGVTVAISEDQRTIVVGAPGWGSVGALGAAYVFVEPPGGWTSTTHYAAKLTSGTQNKTDDFGSTVAISGDVIIVGAPSVMHHDSPYGSAYVFIKPESGWKTTSHFAAELTGPRDQGVQSGFANSVTIHRETIVIGGAEDKNQNGLVFIFVQPRDGWVSMRPSFTLWASDGYPGNQFGASVAINHNTIVVGATQFGGGPMGAGEAYVFVKPEGGWTNGTETARLLASDGKTFDLFGISTSVMGNTVVIGAYEYYVGSGAAYVFVRPPSGWRDTTETAELTASDGQQNDKFGASVAIWGDTVFAGAPGRSAAYEFFKPEDSWKTTSHFDEELQSPGKAQLFGESLALRGKTLVIGGLMGHQSSDPAAAFVFGR